MELINDTLVLRQRYNAFVFGPTVPEIARDKLQRIPGVDADVFCEGAEILYAHRDLLDEAGLTIMGQLFAYASAQGWTAFNADGRCDKIVAGVRRDLGEKGKFPKPEADPDPQAQRREGAANWKAIAFPPPVSAEPVKPAA